MRVIHFGEEANRAVEEEEMKSFRMAGSVCALLCMTTIWTGWSQPAAQSRDRIAMTQALPALDGSHLKVTLVEVTYGPGEFSHPHSHPCPVVGYVIQGAVRMQVKGEKAEIYKAGESFYEAPHGVHEVSENASKTEEATCLVYFVCDHDAPLSVRVPEEKR